MIDLWEKKNCRLCLHGDLISVFKLPDTPLANEFVAEKREQKLYPLEVVQCAACGHSQLRHVVDPKVLFSNYCYSSGTSPSFVRHFEGYAESVNSIAMGSNFGEGRRFVVDVGANDGTLLKAFKKLGWRVLGFEPAANLATTAEAEGIPMWTSFFDDFSVDALVESYGRADVITANNVMAHIDDLDTVGRAGEHLLAPRGVLVFEVQYLGDLLSSGAFDLIYSEHLDYHAAVPLQKFLSRHELDLFDIEHVPTHGGSIRCWVQHKGGPHQHTARRDDLLSNEALTTPSVWAPLAAKVEKTKTELRTILDTFKARKASIVAYGAPAKLTTFCYGLGLTADDFDFVVDDSILKQGKYTPGLHIPVLPPSALIDATRGWPDLVVIAAWNFSEQILKKLQPLMDGGTHVLVPFPFVQLYPELTLAL